MSASRRRMRAIYRKELREYRRKASVVCRVAVFGRFRPCWAVTVVAPAACRAGFRRYRGGARRVVDEIPFAGPGTLCGGRDGGR
jgi:hypothetical protein